MMKQQQTSPDPEYYIEPRLHENLIEIRNGLKRRDKDYVMIVDGLEGSGKSTLGIQMAYIVDPTLCLDRITFTGNEFKTAILNASQCQAVIFDEAFTGLSSRSALSEINRMLVSLMMQMRQKNLFVIIILPSYFLLDKYVALFRAKSLVHVHESRGKRGYFAIYNARLKKFLYLKGHKTYDYGQIRTNFRGRFYGKYALGEEEEVKYRQKKGQAFADMDYEHKENKAHEIKRKIAQYFWKRDKKVNEIEYIMTNDMGIEVRERQVQRYVADLRGK